jgi:hypothetical protein
MFAGWLQAADRDETSVLAFVHEHHAELERVLGYLRENNAAEYERAIGDLSKTVNRLRLLQDRDPKRYELEVRQWQVGSRAELVAARYQMEPREEYHSQIRELLAEQWELKRALLTLERDRAAERLRKLDEQLVDLNQSREGTLERRTQVLTKKRPEKNLGKALEAQSSAASRSSKNPSQEKNASESNKPGTRTPSPKKQAAEKKQSAEKKQVREKNPPTDQHSPEDRQ